MGYVCDLTIEGLADLLGQLPTSVSGSGPESSYLSTAAVLLLTLLLTPLVSSLLPLPRSGRKAASHSGSEAPCPKRPSRQGPESGLDGLASHPWQLARYGSFKYCGLRDSPFSGEPSPRYCFREAEMPALAPPQELAEGSAAKVAELRRALADLGQRGFRLDASTLCRFLRARRGHVGRAAALARRAHAQHVRCRFEQIFEDRRLEAQAELLRPWYHGGGFLGHSRAGDPVVLERLGSGGFVQLCKAVPFEVLLRLDHLHFFRGLGALEEDACRRGTPLKQGLIVIDIGGLGLDALRPGVLMKFRQLMQFRDTVVPEIAKQILVVRAPRFLVSAWNRVKSVALTPETADKVQMATEESSLALLRRHLPDTVIPGYLGGALWTHGDPECRKLLATGGPVPKDVIDRLLALTADDTCQYLSKSHAQTNPSSANTLVEGDDDSVPCKSGREVCCSRDVAFFCWRRS